MKRSKKYTVAFALVAVSSLSGRAFAQDGAASAVGGDAALVFPIGDWSDATGIMLGPLFRFEHALSPQLLVTGRVGYLYGLRKSTTVLGVKTEYGISDIPLWGGVEYYLGERADGLYLGGEAGLNFLSFTVETEGDPMFGSMSGSSSETDLGLNAGAGYRMGDLDLRGSLCIFDLGHAGDSMGLMASVGYNFAKF